jgi:predicted nucleotide-binding protein (sugar kinase/HSP70/actin superfamily)
MTLPFVARCQIAFELTKHRFLIPTIHFGRGRDTIKKELSRFAKTLDISTAKSNIASEYAFEVQNEFWKNIRTKGNEALSILKDSGELIIVIVGRPYNVYDRTVNLNLAAKLREYYGINVIPFDFLDIEPQDIRNIHNNMFWHCGKQILQAALVVRNIPNAHLVYITNFKCGPDSYIKHYITSASGKPFLTLQFDGHSNDAGVMTRCEAYLHSKGFFS